MERLRRLQWQCRRGMLELDTLLEAFLEREGATLTSDEVEQLEALLGCSDPELQRWLIGGSPPDPLHAPMVERIQQSLGG